MVPPVEWRGFEGKLWGKLRQTVAMENPRGGGTAALIRGVGRA